MSSTERYTVVQFTSRQVNGPVTDYESLETHHPHANRRGRIDENGQERGVENSRTRDYAMVEGEFEEVLTAGVDRTGRIREGQVLVSKDFILSSTSHGRNVPVPSPLDGVVGHVDRAQGLVDVVDPATGEVILRSRHMVGITLEPGDAVRRGDALGQQGGVGGYPVHVHMDADKRRLPEFRQYISDLTEGRLQVPAGYTPADGTAARSERSPTSGAAAFSDGTFNLGDRGVGVEALQRQLIQAGYTGKDGQPLKPDGDFGANTKHAVEELQRAHGLQVDGKAGMDSLRALADELQNGRPAPKLPEPERAPGRFEDASLGTDPLFQSLRGHVQTMDRGMGRTPDEASDRVAAALTAEWRANGLASRPDGVVLGQKGGSAQPGEYVFAYSGSSERPSDWVGVKTAEAVQTPVKQSLAKAETLQRQQTMEAQQMAQAQQPANDAPVRAMG
jgi:peptidoglycan hydrolase-like protein with peptidoglycan-binding domain